MHDESRDCEQTDVLSLLCQVINFCCVICIFCCRLQESHSYCQKGFFWHSSAAEEGKQRCVEVILRWSLLNLIFLI